ncbi:zinc-binding protein A33-like [Aplochiton taeniatus]
MSCSGTGLSEEQLECSVCLDVFTDPVSTPCGHNFCQTCINSYWDNNKVFRCPLCKKTFDGRPELCVNTAFRDVVDQFKHSRLSSGGQSVMVLCDVCNDRKLKAVKSCLDCMASYCEEHLEPHKRVASFKRHQLIEPVENLEERVCERHGRPLEMFCRTDQECVCLLCNLLDHKDHDIVTLDTESKERKVLSENRIDSDPGVGRKTLTGLKNTIDTEIQKMSEIELQIIQKYAVDVTLDPDTAHPDLILSEDGKQVEDGDIDQNLPDNPKRFDASLCVLGREGLSSGRFYYEVQVKNTTQWDIGVARESIDRKGEITLSPENGYWTVVLRDGQYKACAGPAVCLSLSPPPQKVGVFVDYEGGQVSFYDVDNRSHIYSYTGQTFTETLYPYFGSCIHEDGRNSASLVITPVSHAN